MRAAAPLLDFADDTAGDVVAGEKLRRTPRVLVALRVQPPLVFVVGRLTFVRFRNVVEHEPAPELIAEHATFAAHPFGHQNAAHAGRPHHAGGMELHELHVHQVGAGVIRERLAVAGVLPAVARDFVRAADAAGSEHNRFRTEQYEPSALTLVRERAHDTSGVGEQREHRALHVHVDALVHPVVLQRSDHLETCPIADVGQPRIFVAAEIPLQDSAVFRPVEQGAPRLQLADGLRRFFGVKLRHAPVVEVLSASHRVGEMDGPTVPVVHVREGRRDAAFRHDGVGLAKQRLTDDPDADALGRGFDRGAQAGASGADHQDLVFVCCVVHER